MNYDVLVSGVALMIGLFLGYTIGGLRKSRAQIAETDSGLIPILQKEKERAEIRLGELAAALERSKIESAERKKENEFLHTLTAGAKSAAEAAETKCAAAIDAWNELKPKFETAKSETVWLKEQLEKSSQQLMDLEKVLSDRFMTLAQKVLEDQNQKFQDFGNKNLGGLITPLREKLQTFEKQIQDTYAKESTERSLLRQQVEGLIGAQAKLSEDANRLSSALRADVKQQGNWG
jgi:DNA recombination protein RmuC